MKSLAHAFSIRRGNEQRIGRLPGFKFPSKDESQAHANQRGLLWLLLDIVASVALKIAEYAAFRITCCLTHWPFCLTLGALLSTIWGAR